MQLLINHLTRMQPGWICAAGIDLTTGKHIRPVAGHGLPNNLLKRNGGPLRLGTVVDLGPSEFCGTVPEIEDRRFRIENLTEIRQTANAELCRTCEDMAESTLRAIFGDDLEWLIHEYPGRAAQRYSNEHRPWGTAAVEQYCGIRSLGCYWAQSAQLICLENAGRSRVRLRFHEDDFAFDVPITDYRVYLADQITPDEITITELASAMANQTRTLIAVGLSRAYRHSETQPARHWLQVNNILVES